MSKLRIINQPLEVSEASLDELDEEINDYWNHREENIRLKHDMAQKKAFKVG